MHIHRIFTHLLYYFYYFLVIFVFMYSLFEYRIPQILNLNQIRKGHTFIILIVIG